MPLKQPYVSLYTDGEDIKRLALIERLWDRGQLYNIPFLQNRTRIEALLSMAWDETRDAEALRAFQKLLGWLEQTQNEAQMS